MRRADRGSATVTVCKQPDVTITTPASIAAGGTATASVPSAGAGTSYAWTIENGVIESAVNLPVVTFRASCSGTVKLTAKVTSSCSAVNQSTVMIPVTAVSATATGSTTIAQGGSATISAVLTGTGPWSIRWSDQAEATQVMTSPHLRPVSPVGTTTYSVTSVTGAGTCAGAVNGAAVVTVRPPVPTVVSATAISGTQVHVSWQFSGSADRFDVRRNGVVIANVAASPFVDSTAQPGTTYGYDVMAVKSNTASAPSARDIATTYMFSAPMLVSEQTVVLASHVLETRAAVNIVRVAAGLGAAVFTDGSLTGLRPKAIHITELRWALDEARTRLGMPPIAYIRNPIAAGETLVFATKLMELR